MARKPKKGEDVNETAFRIVQDATGEPELSPAIGTHREPEKNPAAVALGRLGGKKGGKARADSLTAEMRTEIARKAASARWKDKEKKESE